VDGVQYLHVKVGGLYWVAVTRDNVSPSLITELLMRLYWICRDYFGYVSEEVIRKNFLLVYELLDEVVDYGFPQNSSTERLKQFVLMEPLIVKPRIPGGGAMKLPGGATGPTEVIKSVLDTDRTGAKEEIFVDIVEKLTAIFDANGHQKSSSIVGAIQARGRGCGLLAPQPSARAKPLACCIITRSALNAPCCRVLMLPHAEAAVCWRAGASCPAQLPQIKSYLSGNPPIRLGLSENLILGRRDQRMLSSYGSDADVVMLDTYSIHESVDAERFDSERVLELVPPDGHFALMNYRSSRSFRPPFRVYPLVEDDMYSADKLTLYLRLLAEYPATKTATGVEITVPLPRSVQRVHCETDAPNEAKLLALPGKGAFEQSAEWRERDRKLVWSIKNLKGGREHTLRCRLTVEPGTVESTKRDYGPIMAQFVLPGKPSASGLDVRYMKILKEEKNYAPSRWFRVVAMANSYQIRPH
jgi:AP-4 complex subunit mu-1